jgi:sensor c-di-GMP phosphodiesterase-like protein
MAHELGLMVVVEGIETSEQAEYFRKAGSGILGQGWLFGQPVPASQMKWMVRGGVN